MPDGPVLTARGVAARERLLAAATDEFARHGIAGARVERILGRARVSKAQFYEYVGGKEQLFDTIFETSLQSLVTVVPIDGDDLADWAVRLYDECLAHPDLIRIATWHRLERRPDGALVPQLEELDRANREAVVQAQERGAVIAGSPFDVLALVIGMAMTWSPVSTVYAASSADDPAAHEARRALLHRAVLGAVGRPEG